METGKEIYKEYLCKWVDASDLESRLQVNKEYLWCGAELMEGEASMCVAGGNYGAFTRAPKTQMINGHEVIAPRYDMPSEDCLVIVFNPSCKDGVERITGAQYIENYHYNDFGYFYDGEGTKDALAYAKAHRESK